MENATTKENVTANVIKIDLTKKQTVYLGSKSSTNAKTGKTYHNYYFATGFDDYAQENSHCSGVAVIEEFSYREFLNVKPGDAVALVYGKGFQGKATLEDIIIR